MTSSPFIRDVPAEQAREAWRAAREAAGCPERLPAIEVPLADALGLVTAAPVWATRSSPPFDAAGMDGIAVQAARTIGASETTAVYLAPDAYDVVDTGDPMPPGRDAVVMREHVHYTGTHPGTHPGGSAELRAAVPPYQHVRSIGEDVSAGELLLPEGHRLRAVDLAAAAAAGATRLSVRRRPLVLAVELLRGADEIATTIVAIGSHDLVLDLAASALRADDPLVTLASSNVGSLGGLVALRDGLCHIAGSHLLDTATGEYTVPYVDRVFGAAASEVAVVRLVHRDQGLMVAPGNPLRITGIPDLTRPGLRYVSRQRGAGTRVLLDHELGKLGMDPGLIEGYAREEPTHLAVAAAVAAGRADAGLGIMAAARAYGLDFVPVTREPYDLVIAPGALDSPQLAPLWSLLRSDRFQSAVTALGGYSAKEMGRRIR